MSAERIGPVEQTERAAEGHAIRLLLDGLEVESIHGLKATLDAAREVSKVYAGLCADASDGEFALFSEDELIAALHRLGLLVVGADPPRDAREYLRGYRAGLAAYAWWKDGVQYVGTTGTTLRQAQDEIVETWNFAP